MSRPILLPGSAGGDGQQTTLGVMGGGQLGRMFVQAAQAMGYFTVVLDPGHPDGPRFSLSGWTFAKAVAGGAK